MAVQPQLDRLKSQLLKSGLQQQNSALYQVINTLIDYIRQSTIATGQSINNIINTTVTSTFTYTKFSQDLGNDVSGSFTISSVPGAVGSIVNVVQTADPITSKGDATDEFEMDAIVCTGIITSPTIMTVHWFSSNGSVVVGIYNFAYVVG